MSKNVIYRAPDAVRLNRAVADLNKAEIVCSYNGPQELAFRKVCRRAKIILNKHGLERVPIPPEPAKAEDIERLFTKYR